MIMNAARHNMFYWSCIFRIVTTVQYILTYICFLHNLSCERVVHKKKRDNKGNIKETSRKQKSRNKKVEIKTVYLLPCIKDSKKIVEVLLAGVVSTKSVCCFYFSSSNKPFCPHAAAFIHCKQNYKQALNHSKSSGKWYHNHSIKLLTGSLDTHSCFC